ncbi:hypothetical protein [Oceanidesulfovibrio marinus]|uniref:Uncharacterized protein n=1 Tax=Oceanidesulfovibrio marinus TaxID=370038 RepID=A0A6P1ZJQ5_9BACT|nr:hypothetical protein [Oceanidesulfovibrio marinus]QJT08144.1 hypothetical protein E8L03_04045 [Oceanidesulfovibrio marinus]TVM35040.1 hypothetical protein DQK91_06460 [Oceanidesulfovibrio marinus]
MLHRFSLIASLLFFGVLLALPAHAADDMNLKGWEKDSEYEQLYIPEDREKFYATFMRTVPIEPFPDMAPGTGIIVEDRDTKEEILVHVGPSDFVDKDLSMLRRGDQCKVYGVWNEIDGEWVFLMNKILCENTKLIKVRKTSDGMAWWNLSPEDLAQEQQDNTIDAQ